MCIIILSLYHCLDRAHSESHRVEAAASKMATMAALQSSMTSLSLSSNSFLGQRLSPSTLYAVPVPYILLFLLVSSYISCFVPSKLMWVCVRNPFSPLKLSFFFGNIIMGVSRLEFFLKFLVLCRCLLVVWVAIMIFLMF